MLAESVISCGSEGDEKGEKIGIFFVIFICKNTFYVLYYHEVMYIKEVGFNVLYSLPF